MSPEELMEELKKYLKESGREFVQREFPKVAPILFSPQYMPIVIIGILILAFAILFVGGMTLANVIQALANPFLWVLALLVSAVFKPYKSIIAWALIIAFGLWAYQVYGEVKAITTSPECQIPIIGLIICASYFSMKFIPWVWSFVVTFFASFIAVYITAFISYQIEGM